MPQQRNISPKCKLGIALGVADKTPHFRNSQPHFRNESRWGITRGGVAHPGIIRNVAATPDPMPAINVAALRIFWGELRETWGERTGGWNSGNLKYGRWSAMQDVSVSVFQVFIPQTSPLPPVTSKIDMRHDGVSGALLAMHGGQKSHFNFYAE